MHDAQPVSTPIAPHFKLSAEQCASSYEDIEYISKVLYCSVVSSLMYAMVCSRSDLSYAMSIVSSYMFIPGKGHWRAVQWIFRFLRGTADHCLQFGRTAKGLIGYVDSYCAGDLDREDRSQVMYLLLAVVL
jgi:hypothetical protein